MWNTADWIHKWPAQQLAARKADRCHSPRHGQSFWQSWTPAPHQEAQVLWHPWTNISVDPQLPVEPDPSQWYWTDHPLIQQMWYREYHRDPCWVRVSSFISSTIFPLHLPPKSVFLLTTHSFTCQSNLKKMQDASKLTWTGSQTGGTDGWWSSIPPNAKFWG